MLGSLVALTLLSPPLSAGTAVMIHGAGGGGWEYDFWRPVFQKAGWKVIAPDLKPTAKGLAGTTYADYEAQVKSWSKAAKRPLVLIGASMGGALSLSVAKQLKPDAIILINPASPKGFRTGKPTKFPKVVKWANGPLKDSEDAMPDSDRETILWAWKKWRDESGSVMNTLSAGVIVIKPTCPVLMMISGKDTDVPPAASEKVAKWGGAKIKHYPQASHVGPLLGTQADAVAKDALDWLKKL